MNRISKDLKKEADALLPDEKLKRDLTGRLFPEDGREKHKARSRRGFAFAMSAVACVLVIAIALTNTLAMPSSSWTKREIWRVQRSFLWNSEGKRRPSMTW